MKIDINITIYSFRLSSCPETKKKKKKMNKNENLQRKFEKMTKITL